MNSNVSHLLMIAGLLAATPSIAQQAPPRWRPNPETVIVRGVADARRVQQAMTGTNISEAYIVTASVAVPYSDLNLVRDADASEFDRRIHVAARLVCEELDVKFPRSSYPVIDADDCVQVATQDGLTEADQRIAAARR
jgi:UrcA family protein